MNNKCSRTTSYCHNFPQAHTTKTKLGKKRKKKKKQSYQDQPSQIQVSGILIIELDPGTTLTGPQD